MNKAGILTIVLMSVLLFRSCGVFLPYTDEPEDAIEAEETAGTVSLTVDSVGIILNDTGTVQTMSPAFLADPVPTGFSTTPHWQPHFISANAPEYLKITILSISLIYEGDKHKNIWSGEEELFVDGAVVDMTAINESLEMIEPGTITGVEVRFKPVAKVLGSVSDNFILDLSDLSVGTPTTYYTKPGYFYDAASHTGGAATDAVFASGPAEEAMISLTADGDGTSSSVTFQVHKVLTDGDSVRVTLLFDLNMVLRFYNGRNTVTDQGQPNPPDPNDKAFFFAHSIMVDGGSFMGCFLGEIGTIEGYKTYAVIYDQSDPNRNMAGTGWITLVYDAEGNFVSGQIYGDDDNSISAGKGVIVNYILTDGAADLTDGIMGGTIYGFERLSTIGDITPVLSFDPPNNFTNYAGETVFRLLLKQ